jgi:hypothetical protein
MDRDRAYIAHLIHQLVIDAGGEFPGQYRNLLDYVEAAEAMLARGNIVRNDNRTSSDPIVLEAIFPLAECISVYAETLRDFHLFFIDTGSFLRSDNQVSCNPM